MLSRFDAISHIMPYYGQTHRAFLLLSSLCSETRNKLDEFYDEFVIWMKEHWRYIEVYSTEQITSLFMPNDLFQVYVKCRYQEIFDAFIELIENLRNFKGWYFNEHYMNSKIKIRDPILANVEGIKTLYAYADVLKSIQVVLCKEDPYDFKVQCEPGTLNTNNKYFDLIKRTDISMHKCLFIFLIATCEKLKS